MPNVGDLVFVNGNEACIVVHVDDEDNAYVGHFASIEKFERGDYGLVPGPKAEHPPSWIDPAAAPVAPVAGVPVVPVAGGVPVAAPAEPQAAPAVQV